MTKIPQKIRKKLKGMALDLIQDKVIPNIPKIFKRRRRWDYFISLVNNIPVKDKNDVNLKFQILDFISQTKSTIKEPYRGFMVDFSVWMKNNCTDEKLKNYHYIHEFFRRDYKVWKYLAKLTYEPS